MIKVHHNLLVDIPLLFVTLARPVNKDNLILASAPELIMTLVLDELSELLEGCRDGSPCVLPLTLEIVIHIDKIRNDIV